MSSTETVESKDLLLLLESQHRQSIFEIFTPLEHLLFVKDRSASKIWIDKCKELIEVLTKLPFKKVDSNDEEPDRKRIKKEAALHLQLHYDLAHDLRIKIVDFLLKGSVFLNDNFEAGSDDQNDFIEQSRNLVRNVIDLKFKVVEVEIVDLIPAEVHHPSSSTSTIYSALIDVNQPMVVVELEFDDIKSFFKDKNGRESDFFYCNGTPFFLSLAVTANKEGKKFLKVFLQIQNFVFESNWHCKCWYSIILMSRAHFDHYEDFNHTFLDNYGFGESQFISMEDLFDQKRKFIHDDDKIKLRVHLKADKVVFQK